MSVIVNSSTQKIVVDPANSSVSVINAGPMGPVGLTGPPTTDASVLTTGVLPIGRIADGSITSNKVDSSIATASSVTVETNARIAADALLLPKTGGTMTGVLNIDTGAATDTVLSNRRGRENVGSTTDLGATQGVWGTAIGRVTKIIRMFASQTADPLQIQNSAATVVTAVKPSGSLALGSAGSFGGGVGGVISMANATIVPTSNPAGGGVLYASSGALLWRGSGGAITTVASATTPTSTSGQVFGTGTSSPAATNIDSNTAIDAPGLTVTLPVAGNYEIVATIRGHVSIPVNNSAGIIIGLYTSANVLVANSETLITHHVSTTAAAVNAQSSGTLSFRLVGAAAGSVYKIRFWNAAANTFSAITNDVNGRCQMSYKLIL